MKIGRVPKRRMQLEPSLVMTNYPTGVCIPWLLWVSFCANCGGESTKA
jgi:hypothetical protein